VSGGIYLLRGEEELREMVEESYDTEGLLATSSIQNAGARLELLRRLNKIPGLAFPPDAITLEGLKTSSPGCSSPHP
jgi:hypothetical protein